MSGRVKKRVNAEILEVECGVAEKEEMDINALNSLSALGDQQNTLCRAIHTVIMVYIS